MEVTKTNKMAKIKEHYLGEMTQHEIDVYLYNKQFRDMEYEEWRTSDDYADLVNNELLDLKPTYSAAEIKDAIRYAVSSVMIPSEEVGVDVYGKLIEEKLFESLNNSYERN